MKSTNDLDLLGEFTRDHSQEAFTALVQQHLDLVYCAALRQVRSHQLAEEVVQSVFTDLARSAHRLKPDTILPAWLYEVTRRTAVSVVRGEARRQLREQIAVEMNAMNANADDWMQIEPLLDDAMHALDETDRAAVLLRFFENKSLREVGQTLGTTDDTARKRVNRAIERLREFFAKRGVTVGASLVAVISANAVQAAPVGLAVTISTAAALAGTTLITTATATVGKAIVMTALQKTLIAAGLVVAVTAPLYLQHRATESLRAENAALRAQTSELAALPQLKAENQRLAEQLRIAAERPQADRRELLQLRGQVGMLRQAAQENPRLRTELNDLAKRLQQTETERGGGDEQNPEMKMMINKVTFATIWGHALLKFAQKNGGRMPLDLATAALYLKDNELLPSNWRNTDPIITQAATNGIGIDRFELIYHGLLTNLSDRPRLPQDDFGNNQTILMREKEPFRAADGKWKRVYVFGNGFGATLWSDDGDFKDAESPWSPKRSPP